MAIRKWKYEPEPNGRTFTIWEDDDTRIAEVETESDARLIAALPDLQTDLEEIYKHLQAAWARVHYEEIRQAMLATQDAIAKLHGE